MCTTFKTILKNILREENIIIAIILGWYDVLSSITQVSITWLCYFYKLKNQTYWLSAKYMKLKQITVKGIFKLLNEIRQIKVSYKLYSATQMSYIILQGIKIILALRKPNIPKN